MNFFKGKFYYIRFNERLCIVIQLQRLFLYFQVFVVLEGEITVVIHNTNFNAKKGDSFYIPPKNYYNLINNKAREAELSLLQYQYSGPLPSVPAGSQSGQTANGVQN